MKEAGVEGDLQNAKIKDAIPAYYHYAGFGSEASPKHDIGHLLATSLLDPDHLMDWDFTKRNMPRTRIADYAAEPISDVYWIALECYTADDSWETGLKEIYESYYDPQKSVSQNILETLKRLAHNTIRIDRETLEKVKLSSGGEELPESEGSPGHRRVRRRYAKNPESIQWPSLREIEYHMEKAIEFCKTFAAAHGGKYPSQYTDEQILELPLTDFTIKHEFPGWLREEWAAQRAAAASVPDTHISGRGA